MLAGRMSCASLELCAHKSGKHWKTGESPRLDPSLVTLEGVRPVDTVTVD